MTVQARSDAALVRDHRLPDNCRMLAQHRQKATARIKMCLQRYCLLRPSQHVLMRQPDAKAFPSPAKTNKNYTAMRLACELAS